jgi:hypothetical protein
MNNQTVELINEKVNPRFFEFRYYDLKINGTLLKPAIAKKQIDLLSEADIQYGEEKIF